MTERIGPTEIVGLPPVSRRIEDRGRTIANLKAPSSDEITLAYVDASLTCTDRLFKYPSCREIVLQGERFFTSKGAEKKSPYHSIYKLEGFVKKGKTQANIEWGLAQTLYAIQEGHYDVG